MKKVYVTERGKFDDYGRFHGKGVIGVDSMLRLAVSYPVRLGFYHHQVVIDDISMVVTYKCDFSNRGYRITVIDTY